jgi:radical SAM protein with 4Fe4S-binding SPASM domain
MLPNWRDIPGLYELCRMLGVSKMSLLRFVPQTRGRVNNRMLALSKAEFEQLQHVMHGLQGNYDGITTDLRFGCPIDFRHTIYPGFTVKQRECHAGMDLILVRPQGEVHPCAAWKSLPEMDNIRDKPLREIWEHGEVFKALREYRESGWATIRGTCAMCKYQESCRGGCPAQRMHALKLQGMRTHDSSIADLYIDAPDPLCPIGR